MTNPIDLKGKTEVELLELFKSYQDALKTEKRYHAIVDNMMEGFQMIDRDWRYLYVNGTVAKQGKYTQEELLGYTMMEKYPGIENTELFKVLRRCMEEREPQQFQNEFVFPDGSKGWFDLSIQPIKEGIFILSMDVSDHKLREMQIEEQVIELQQLLHKISHVVRIPVVNILGVTHYLDGADLGNKDLQDMLNTMKESAQKLDDYTRDLSDFVQRMHWKMSS